MRSVERKYKNTEFFLYFYPNPALRFRRLRVENISRPCGKDKDINAEPK